MRRRHSVAPYLPLEIKSLITAELGRERDMSTLIALCGTNSQFATCSREWIYAHVDFRGKSFAALGIFGKYIAPYFGHFVTSLAHKPVDEVLHDSIESPRARLDSLRAWDAAYSSALVNLHRIKVLDLTVPTLDFESFYGSSMDIILRWTKMSVMTVRSAGWGREDFISATDSFNAKSVATLLRAFPELSSFRALGISGFDISPDGPSLRAFILIENLHKLESLHIAGCWLQEFTPHFSRIKPPITHLVIAEDTEIEWSELHELILTLTTLVSLSLRQAGEVISGDSTYLPFSKEALPNLKRLVLVLDGEILYSLDQFVNIPNLDRLELGSNDGDFLPTLIQRLKGGAFDGLKELGYVSASIKGDDWERLHEVCEERKIMLEPGFSSDLDFAS